MTIKKRITAMIENARGGMTTRKLADEARAVVDMEQDRGWLSLELIANVNGAITLACRSFGSADDGLRVLFEGRVLADKHDRNGYEAIEVRAVADTVVPIATVEDRDYQAGYRLGCTLIKNFTEERAVEVMRGRGEMWRAGFMAGCHAGHSALMVEAHRCFALARDADAITS